MTRLWLQTFVCATLLRTSCLYSRRSVADRAAIDHAARLHVLPELLLEAHPQVRLAALRVHRTGGSLQGFSQTRQGWQGRLMHRLHLLSHGKPRHVHIVAMCPLVLRGCLPLLTPLSHLWPIGCLALSPSDPPWPHGPLVLPHAHVTPPRRHGISLQLYLLRVAPRNLFASTAPRNLLCNSDDSIVSYIASPHSSQFRTSQLWQFLLYPSMANSLLSIFYCVPLEDGTSWLRVDLSIQCVDSGGATMAPHMTMITFALVMIAVHTIGTPAIYAYLFFWKHNGVLKALQEQVTPCGFHPCVSPMPLGRDPRRMHIQLSVASPLPSSIIHRLTRSLTICTALRLRTPSSIPLSTRR